MTIDDDDDGDADEDDGDGAADFSTLLHLLGAVPMSKLRLKLEQTMRRWRPAGKAVLSKLWLN